ncbi:subtilosin A family bacteriocin [Staphylococcus pseudintermedius]|nr:subtilosin A family bacteriocin [Staphylococcus pseudintermedius]EGQ1686182.1 subtilosin A family bacteriocin [Staphylococcus pseudintermedius]EGQ3323460.1 subtilosin A family bacteriocin [Staphylococcus pseudintermedius]EGQ3485444.1 subtilosin A family bacteriocin [Staphylococcus pseudintermedius]EGQ3604204.1 subtilosin A family bacteriocin [Staphylococcus pseudintermedius]
MEKGIMVSNKGCSGCSTCSIGAACLIDGPLPDFEVMGITGIFGLTS